MFMSSTINYMISQVYSLFTPILTHLKIFLKVAKESADVIILDDNFSTIVTVAKWGRSVYINIQKFVQFQLTVNVVALVVNFSSACLTGKSKTLYWSIVWKSLRYLSVF